VTENSWKRGWKFLISTNNISMTHARTDDFNQYFIRPWLVKFDSLNLERTTLFANDRGFNLHALSTSFVRIGGWCL
jgi:hypothetical protein